MHKPIKYSSVIEWITNAVHLYNGAIDVFQTYSIKRKMPVAQYVQCDTIYINLKQ